MNASLFEQLKRQYAFDTWSGRNRLDEELFIWQFLVGQDAFPTWRSHRIQALDPPSALQRVPLLGEATERGGLPLRPYWVRTIHSLWTAPGNGSDVLLNTDFYECASRQSAHELLTRLLAEFQSPIPAVQEQKTIGDVAFGSRSGTTLLVARANLVVLLRNAGQNLVPTDEVAARFDQGLIAKPEIPVKRGAAQVRRFQLSENQVQVGGAVSLKLTTLVRAEHAAWYKIFAPPGDIWSEEGRLVYVPRSSGSQEITVYSIGADGQPTREKFALRVV